MAEYRILAKSGHVTPSIIDFIFNFQVHRVQITLAGFHLLRGGGGGGEASPPNTQVFPPNIPQLQYKIMV